MLKQILHVPGVQQLNRKQQIVVKGGYGNPDVFLGDPDEKEEKDDGCGSTGCH